MSVRRSIYIAVCSLAGNMLLSAYYLSVGIMNGSWWLVVLGVYYLILSVARCYVLLSGARPDRLLKYTGIMLRILSSLVGGIVILSLVKDRGNIHNKIVMISIAVYTFTKITIAAANLLKSKRLKLAQIVVLRNISFADAFVSLYALQRSMLVSFEGMTEFWTRIMNLMTGTSVMIVVFVLGGQLVKKANRLAAARKKIKPRLGGKD